MDEKKYETFDSYEQYVAAIDNVVCHPFMANNAMQSVKNKVGMVVMPWFKDSDMTDYYSNLMAKKYEYPVFRGKCPMPVEGPDGKKQACNKTMEITVEDLRTGYILLKNRVGKLYNKVEAYAAAGPDYNYGVLTKEEPKFAVEHALC